MILDTPESGITSVVTRVTVINVFNNYYTREH